MAVFGIRPVVRAQLGDPARFAAAFDFLDACFDRESEIRRSIDGLAPGEKKRVELAGGAFALLEAYHPRPRAACCWESHVAHIDVQMLVEGTEVMDVLWRGRMSLPEDRTPAQDVILYRGDVAGSALLFTPGDVGVYFPDDAHRSQIAADDPVLVRKVVVKVPVGG